MFAGKQGGMYVIAQQCILLPGIFVSFSWLQIATCALNINQGKSTLQKPENKAGSFVTHVSLSQRSVKRKLINRQTNKKRTQMYRKREVELGQPGFRYVAPLPEQHQEVSQTAVCESVTSGPIISDPKFTGFRQKKKTINRWKNQ